MHANHFHLLRLLAATAVLLSHSFTIAGASSEPLCSIGFSLGGLAVDIFFVTSGFLVAGSLLQRGNLISFGLARFLRIFPGLFTANTLVILACGILASTLPFAQFLQASETWQYLWANTSLVLGELRPALPGVFVDNRLPAVVNGSLWSLPIEVKLYLLLAGAGLVSLVALRSRWKHGILAATILLAMAGTALHFLQLWGGGAEKHSIRLLGLFFLGSLWQVADLRRRLPIHSGAVTTVLLIGLGLTAHWTFGNTGHTQTLVHKIFLSSYALLLPMSILWLAYLPGTRLQKAFGKADYSYGIYVYAFPVQQLVSMHWPTCSPWQIFWYSLPVVVGLAALSWHGVEKPCLGLKTKLLR